jgi:hypothetical protein
MLPFRSGPKWKSAFAAMDENAAASAIAATRPVNRIIVSLLLVSLRRRTICTALFPAALSNDKNRMVEKFLDQYDLYESIFLDIWKLRSWMSLTG